MHRYVESLSALNIAFDLMIEEGDTLLVAAIAHPLHLVEAQIMQKRSDIIAVDSQASAAGRPLP